MSPNGEEVLEGGGGNGGADVVSEIDFHHPYTPYHIQVTFMKTVYDILERGGGGVGILESPTGTGKSLSLICASLTWLRDHKRKRFEEGLKWASEPSDEPSWVLEHMKARQEREMLLQREDMESRLARVRAKEKAQKERFLEGAREVKRRRVRTDVPDQVSNEADMNEDQFLLDDYDSDSGKLAVQDGGFSDLSPETRTLMQKAGMNAHISNENEEDIEDETKIFYCSRTHSQLTQFISELRRVKFPPAIPADVARHSKTESESVEELKHLTLGSRKNLCINPVVARFRSLTTINERCLELQQPKVATDKRCPFLPNKDNRPLVNDFRDHALATIRDIEDLGTLGKEIGICPYYASRKAIRPSEIVTLPYPLLLQKSAREALGIDLQGHVIVVDEAHNLMDAISTAHSFSISLRHLKKAREGLGIYLHKFRSKMKGRNRAYVAQVARLTDSLIGYLDSKRGTRQSEGIVESGDILAGKGVDQINLFKLLKYLQESRLARKVEGYITYAKEQSVSNEIRGYTTRKDDQLSDPTAPVLQLLESLLPALANPTKEGRFFYAIDPESQDILLKYLLLDPTHHFQEFVSSARAVILAGGTMSPMSDYTSHLLSYLPSDKITTLSCGHVIPKNNLLAWALGKGPSGNAFEFTYSRRVGKGREEMIDELGASMLNICAVVPDGVVIFFPSYAYLDVVCTRWEKSAIAGKQSIWERLRAKKVLFKESQEVRAGREEDVLLEYGEAIDAGKGGLLLCVVGGKMSEGINFSDRLGRCVVVVGLPFPNIQSAEWRSKLEHIESATVEKLHREGVIGEEAKNRGKAEGREFYESVCMRAVNQSVGRAIRHRGDYAAIVMIDVRFGGEKIQGKLPGWIREGLVDKSVEKNFGEMMGRLSAFFRDKKGA